MIPVPLPPAHASSPITWPPPGRTHAQPRTRCDCGCRRHSALTLRRPTLGTWQSSALSLRPESDQWLDEVAFAISTPIHGTLGSDGPGCRTTTTIVQRLQDMRTIMSLARTLNGKSDTRQSQYSANFVTDYDVTGKLKGMGKMVAPKSI